MPLLWISSIAACHCLIVPKWWSNTVVSIGCRRSQQGVCPAHSQLCPTEYWSYL